MSEMKISKWYFILFICHSSQRKLELWPTRIIWQEFKYDKHIYSMLRTHSHSHTGRQTRTTPRTSTHSLLRRHRSHHPSQILKIYIAHHHPHHHPSTRNVPRRHKRMPIQLWINALQTTSLCLLRHRLNPTNLQHDLSRQKRKTIPRWRRTQHFQLQPWRTLPTSKTIPQNKIRRNRWKSVHSGSDSRRRRRSHLLHHPLKIFYFHSRITRSRSVQLKIYRLLQETLDGNLKDVQKAFIYKGNLILFSARSGIFIYKIDKNTKKLTLVQKFTNPTDLYFSDMEFEPTTQMLYLLAMNKALIKVYHYEPSDFPNPDKTLTIFVEYDNIEFPSVTSNHIKGIN